MTSYKISPDAPKVYSEDFTIRSYHVDINRRLTIQKLCSFFQDIAGNHTVACGVGWEVMQEENMFWVLSRLRIEVTKYPEWRDRITIQTWSNGLDGLLAVRHFKVLSSEGELLIKGISMWLMVNTETRRLIRPEGYMEEFPLNTERLFDENPGKIDALKDVVAYDAAKVTFTETDMNQHMNNVSYIDRIIDTFDTGFLMEHQIKEFEINFLKEARPGEMILVQRQELNNMEFLHNIVLEEDGKEMVRTRMIWE